MTAKPAYVDSIRILKERVEILGDALPVVERRPRHDDDVIGPSILRMLVDDVSLADLTLPGLAVHRSELRRIVFCNTDLHLGAINWNDIIECDFAHADLTDADLRACRFVQCNFRGAILTRSDLRGSTFDRCVFEETILDGAQLYRRPKLLGLIPIGFDQHSLPLSQHQRSVVRWCPDAPDPGW